MCDITNSRKTTTLTDLYKICRVAETTFVFLTVYLRSLVIVMCVYGLYTYFRVTNAYTTVLHFLKSKQFLLSKYLNLFNIPLTFGVQFKCISGFLYTTIIIFVIRSWKKIVQVFVKQSSSPITFYECIVFVSMQFWCRATERGIQIAQCTMIHHRDHLLTNALSANCI